MEHALFDIVFTFQERFGEAVHPVGVAAAPEPRIACLGNFTIGSRPGEGGEGEAINSWAGRPPLLDFLIDLFGSSFFWFGSWWVPGASGKAPEVPEIPTDGPGGHPGGSGARTQKPKNTILLQ